MDTHGEKLKAIQLHMLKTQWPMCKADAHVFALANKLENNTLGNTLLKVEADTDTVNYTLPTTTLFKRTSASTSPTVL